MNKGSKNAVELSKATTFFARQVTSYFHCTVHVLSKWKRVQACPCTSHPVCNILENSEKKITAIFIPDFLTKIHYKINSLQKIIVHNYLIMIS